jgi:hypothetical protein
MNVNKVPDEIVRQAISSGFIQLYLIFAEMQNILSQSEVYDAELSMKLAEAWTDFEKAGVDLLRDSLNRQGLTYNQIDDISKNIKRMLDD